MLNVLIHPGVFIRFSSLPIKNIFVELVNHYQWDRAANQSQFQKDKLLFFRFMMTEAKVYDNIQRVAFHGEQGFILDDV